jgi:hypothetical protein
MTRLRVALVLMVFGVLLLAVGVVRSLSDGDSESESTTPERATVLGTGPCGVEPCPANGDINLARAYEVPSVAVDPKDPNHMVVTDNNLVGGNCTWHVSFDAGRSWKDGVFEPPAGFTRCALDSAGFLVSGNVVIGPTGTVYFTYTSIAPGAETESVMVATSTDGGRTFAPARVAVAGGGAQPGYRRPSITAAAGEAGKDRLLLSFWACPKPPGSNSELCSQSIFASSADGGQTFSPPVVANPPPIGNSPSPPVLGVDGTIYMTQLRRIAPMDTVLMLARSNDGGRTFTTSEVGAHAELGGRYDSAKLAMGPKGELYTVFSHKPTGAFQVAFRRSLDNGATWSKEVRVNRSETGSYFSPNIAVAPSGRIDVVFYGRSPDDTVDAGNLIGNVGTSDTVLWASSTDGGASFGLDRRINHTDRGIDRRIGYWEEVGDWYVPSVASTDSVGVFVWSDTYRGTKDKDDNQETYLRRVDFATAGDRTE